MELTLSTCFIQVHDPDIALAFYRDTLGLEVRNDVANGGFRWITVGSTAQPGVSIVLSALVFLIGSTDWWRGFLAATIASLLAAAGSLVPIHFGLKRGYHGVMSGFLASSGLRFVLTIGVAAFAVGVGGYPKIATFVLVLPYYAATLAAEVWSLTNLPTRS